MEVSYNETPSLNASQKPRREVGAGTTNRLWKPWPGDVGASASWVARKEPVAKEVQ